MGKYVQTLLQNTGQQCGFVSEESLFQLGLTGSIQDKRFNLHKQLILNFVCHVACYCVRILFLIDFLR